MKWTEFTVFTTDIGTEHVCAALTAVGIDQLSIEESSQAIEAFLRENTYFWDYADTDEMVTAPCPCVKAYLSLQPESEPKLQSAREAIARLRTLDVGIDLGSLEIREAQVDDEDWENNWKAYYKPFCIGEKLLVKPSWEEVAPDSEKVVIELDPGMAFGTGLHQTTRMCMEFLEANVQPGDMVLDLGSGSGILSITSLLLGAKQAVAVDIDPVAKTVAMENAQRNGISEEQYLLHIGNVLDDAALQSTIAGSYQVVLANIVADVIIALTPNVGQYLAADGILICSGIIDERKDDVIAALAANGYCTVQVKEDAGWVALLAKRA